MEQNLIVVRQADDFFRNAITCDQKGSFQDAIYYYRLAIQYYQQVRDNPPKGGFNIETIHGNIEKINKRISEISMLAPNNFQEPPASSHPAQFSLTATTVAYPQIPALETSKNASKPASQENSASAPRYRVPTSDQKGSNTDSNSIKIEHPTKSSTKSEKKNKIQRAVSKQPASTPLVANESDSIQPTKPKNQYAVDPSRNPSTRQPEPNQVELKPKPSSEPAKVDSKKQQHSEPAKVDSKKQQHSEPAKVDSKKQQHNEPAKVDQKKLPAVKSAPVNDEENNQLRHISSTRRQKAQSQLIKPAKSAEEDVYISDFVVKPQLYRKVKTIGQGAFGSVFLVQSSVDQKFYAMKEFHNEIVDYDQERSYFREIDMMIHAHHPAVMKLTGFSMTNMENRHAPILVLEYLPNGSLQDIISKKREFTLTQKYISLYGVAVAMAYLHSKNIVHRDLKPANVLLNECLEPVVGDFGLSKVMEEKSLRQTQASGSPVYMAPELLLRQSYTNSIDVYAYGILSYEVLSGVPAFSKIKSILDLVNSVVVGKRPSISSVSLPKQWVKLITACWDQEPSKRPTFSQIAEDFINRKLPFDDIDEKVFNRYVKKLERA